MRTVITVILTILSILSTIWVAVDFSLFWINRSNIYVVMLSALCAAFLTFISIVLSDIDNDITNNVFVIGMAILVFANIGILIFGYCNALLNLNENSPISLLVIAPFIISPAFVLSAAFLDMDTLSWFERILYFSAIVIGVILVLLFLAWVLPNGSFFSMSETKP